MTRQVIYDAHTGTFRYPASPWAKWYAALIVGASLLLVALLAGGCCSITVRDSVGVKVYQTRVVSTDASIPASVIP